MSDPHSSNQAGKRNRKKYTPAMRKAYLEKKGKTPNKEQRGDLMRMYGAMYGKPLNGGESSISVDLQNEIETPLERETMVNTIVDEIESQKERLLAETKTPAVPETQMIASWTDPTTGQIMEIGPGVAKSYAETKAYGETQLWPGLPQVDQDALFGLNVMLIEVRRMTKGKAGYPPYFCVLAACQKFGTFTFLSSGEVVNRTISKLSGIDVETGARNEYTPEMPVVVTFTLVERENGNPYFVIEPPATESAE